MNCTGENLSPPLAWANPPTGTKSFALMVHDPDAPTGSGWWHWVVYDIPADVAALPEGAGKEGGGALLPKERRWGTPTSARPPMVVHVRRPAAASITITSRCLR